MLTVTSSSTPIIPLELDLHFLRPHSIDNTTLPDTVGLFLFHHSWLHCLSTHYSQAKTSSFFRQLAPECIIPDSVFDRVGLDYAGPSW